MMKLLKNLLVIASTFVILSHATESFAIGATTRISVRNDLNPPDDGMGVLPSISANGRFVAFQSLFPLVAEDANLSSDVYVHDRLTKLNKRISVSSSGEEANNHSGLSSISADGRYVVFSSIASNLVPEDTNDSIDVFVHDRITKQTTRVNVNSTGNQANKDLLFDDPFATAIFTKNEISADGRFIVFASGSNNLVSNDTNNLPDVFLHDRLTKQTTRVSVNTDGTQGNLGSVPIQISSGRLDISADGRFVVFKSQLNNLVSNDTNNDFDIFIHDRQTKQTTLVNTELTGKQAPDSDFPSISADGRFVAFMSASENLVANDTNKALDVFLYDRIIKQVSRVSVASNGEQANESSLYPEISADGNVIAFDSGATNLTGLPVYFLNVYVHNRLSGKTSIVNVNTEGNQGSGWGSLSVLPTPDPLPSISADGRYVAFDTNAPFLVSGDTNEAPDIFVRDQAQIKENQADLQLSVTQKPVALTTNAIGNYSFTITNNGPDTVGVLKLQHLYSNGVLISLTPSKGVCKRYATLSLCNFGTLLSGENIVLQASLKGLRNPLRQQISISSGGRLDPKPGNNYLTVNTTVMP